MVTKLIKIEEDVAVRACEKVKYAPSKLYENKGRALKSHIRHHHRTHKYYFGTKYPCLYGMLG